MFQIPQGVEARFLGSLSPPHLLTPQDLPRPTGWKAAATPSPQDLEQSLLSLAPSLPTRLGPGPYPAFQHGWKWWRLSRTARRSRRRAWLTEATR